MIKTDRKKMATGEGNLLKGDSFSTFAEVLQLIKKRKLMYNENLVKSFSLSLLPFFFEYKTFNVIQSDLVYSVPCDGANLLILFMYFSKRLLF